MSLSLAILVRCQHILTYVWRPGVSTVIKLLTLSALISITCSLFAKQTYDVAVTGQGQALSRTV